MRSTQRPSIVPCPPRVPMVDRPFPPRRHRWPTSSCARQPRKSRRESPRCRVDERRPNRRQLIRAQWALSAELIAPYCDKEAA
jgi:hypothetical protein